MILHLLPTLLHLSNQEDGSMPGPGLTALQTVLYFVLAPIALFTVISIVVLLATADRSKGRTSDLSRID
jgi:hypothetical protein